MEKPPHVSPKIVLLVDDEPDLLIMVGAILRQAGYDVITASDAAQALLVSESPQHLYALVTDMELGEGRMNGVELAAFLRIEHPRLRVVVISGSLVAEDAAARHGFTFLAKPFKEAVLKAHLDDPEAAAGA